MIRFCLVGEGSGGKQRKNGFKKKKKNFDNVVLILEIIRNQFVAFARFMSVWSASVLWSSFAYLARKLGKTQGKQA